MLDRKTLFTKKKIIGAVISFFIMTAVYMYLARSYPMEQRLKSSFGHSTFCFVMTFATIFMMNYFYMVSTKFKYTYILTVLLSGVTGLALTTIVHLLLGTPDLFITVFYSGLLGAPMFLLYPYKLVKGIKFT